MNRRIVYAGLATAALLALPLVLSQSLLNAAIQMLIAALFATAFNLLCGQGGMLSFGHAAYFGVGAFAAVHAMRAFGGAGLLPTPLLPLAGACAGLLFGALAGWFATKRSGTYFAMITLALAELLHSLAPHLKSLFGGEGGVSGMRMPSWGLSFGSVFHVYYLTLAWVLGSMLLLYLYTLTPVGRLTLGLRENAHRLRFLGYNVHHLGVLVFAVSAMFSGVAGALHVLNHESVNYVVFDAHLSAAVVLNSFIGGVKVFLGPALGAALMTFFGYVVSDVTRVWLLYQGVIFVLVMMFMPTGLAGLVTWWSTQRVTHGAGRLLPIVVLSVLSALVISAGSVLLLEILQRLFSQEYRSLAALNRGASWPPIRLFGADWHPFAASTWAIPALVLAAGLGLGHYTRRRGFALAEAAEAAGDAATPGIAGSAA